jgi:uncharacterized protein
MTRLSALFLASLILAAAGAAQAADSSCYTLKKAAERGDPDGEFEYGRSLSTGACGFRVNKSEAALWYRRAAEQGEVEAQRALAEMYFSGDGVPRDYVEAKRWFAKAANMGDGPSQLRLAYLYAEKHFPPLKPSYPEAERWFRKAAEQNTGDAQFRLGNFYLNYKHPPDYKQALLWLQKAAQGGNRTAMFDLGRLQLSGTGTPKDTKAGIGWIKKSAEAGTLQAQQTLVQIYSDGKVAPKDAVEALKWTLKIADTPTAAAFYLSRAGDAFFEGGESIPQNYPAARKYYERAARRGDAHALERLALIYKEGLGVEKDEAKAKEYEARLQR